MLVMKYISDLHFEKTSLSSSQMYALIIDNTKDISFTKDNSLLIVGDFFPFDLIEMFKELLVLLSRGFDEVWWIVGNSDVRNKHISRNIISSVNSQIDDMQINNIKVVNFCVVHGDDFTIFCGINEKVLLKNKKLLNATNEPVIIATHYPLSKSVTDYFMKNFNCHCFISGHIHKSLLEVVNDVYFLRNPLIKKSS